LSAEQNVPGELRYAIDAELKGIGLCAMALSLCPKGGRCFDTLSNSIISTRNLYVRPENIMSVKSQFLENCRPDSQRRFIVSKSQADIAEFCQRMAASGADGRVVWRVRG
jgi:hypothetical protein